MKLQTYILFIALLISSALHAHPLKMCVGKLDYNTELQQSQLSLSFFIDDFSAHLSELYQLPVTEENITEREPLEIIADYVSKRFALYLGRDVLKMQLTDAFIAEENVLKVSFTIAGLNPSEISEIKIFNSLLFDAFPTQINVLNIEFSDSQTIQFTHSSPTQIINIE